MVSHFKIGGRVDDDLGSIQFGTARTKQLLELKKKISELEECLNDKSLSPSKIKDIHAAINALLIDLGCEPNAPKK